ncbi:MAG: lipopolysaccharide assembly protein LapA domain-containing protein [Alphaproteobacteria bacterium]|nr:lipopolysaccharide assembly protein LapA domain-containing protein [Alphaproteobacteria bacterium]
MRLISWLFLLPFVLFAISFSVSNRTLTTLKLWPLPFEVELPLVLFTLLVLLLGFLLGGYAHWQASADKRRLFRDERAQNQSLKKENASLRQELELLKQGNTGPSGDIAVLTDEADVEENTSSANLPARTDMPRKDSKWASNTVE